MEAGARIHFIPESCSTLIKRIIYLFDLLFQLKPDIIHSWSIHDNAYAGLLGRLLNIKTIIGSVRGSLSGTGFKYLSFLKKTCALRLVPRLMVNSPTIKKELINYGISRNKIFFLPNCIRPPDQANIKSSFIIPSLIDGEEIICTVGNLRKNKNHSLFIKLMKQLIISKPNVNGWIIGQSVADEPQMYNELESEIKTAGLSESVYLLGFQKNVLPFINKCSVFVMTSITEGMPNVIMEAMSLSKPIVSSKVGAIPQLIINKSNGYLINDQNPKNYANAIMHILDNPNIASDMGEASKKLLIQNYSTSSMVARLSTYYLDSFNINHV